MLCYDYSGRQIPRSAFVDSLLFKLFLVLSIQIILNTYSIKDHVMKKNTFNEQCFVMITQSDSKIRVCWWLVFVDGLAGESAAYLKFLEPAEEVACFATGIATQKMCDASFLGWKYAVKCVIFITEILR